MTNEAPEIEAAIQAQDTPRAFDLIEAYLRAEKESPSARFAASEYFRRLSEYSHALRTLDCDKEPSSLSELPADEVKNYIQHARLRNMLGASNWALRFFSTLSPTQRADHASLIAPVLLSNYRFAEALPLFKPLAEALHPDTPYRQRLQTVSVCDALIGLERFSEAIELARRILAHSQEPLLLGILHEVIGSAHLRAREFDLARSAFECSAQHYPSRSGSLDVGYLKKCLGALAVETGDFEAAARHFADAWTLLYRPGMKPEVWLDLLFWQGLAEFRTRKDTFPIFWSQLLIYPQPISYFRDEIEKHTDLPNPLVFEPGVGSRPRICYEFGTNAIYLSDEGNLPHGAPAKINMDVTEVLHATLVAAAPYGVAEYRLTDHLWSGESWANETVLRKRMDQVIFRTRAQFETEVLRKHLHLSLSTSSDLSGYSVRKKTKPEVPGAIFLERWGNRPFSRKDVEEFFGVSRDLAYELLGLWTKAQRAKKNDRTFYSPI